MTMIEVESGKSEWIDDGRWSSVLFFWCFFFWTTRMGEETTTGTRQHTTHNLITKACGVMVIARFKRQWTERGRSSIKAIIITTK